MPTFLISSKFLISSNNSIIPYVVLYQFKCCTENNCGQNQIYKLIKLSWFCQIHFPFHKHNSILNTQPSSESKPTLQKKLSILFSHGSLFRQNSGIRNHFLDLMVFRKGHGSKGPFFAHILLYGTTGYPHFLDQDKHFKKRDLVMVLKGPFSPKFWYKEPLAIHTFWPRPSL